MNDLKLKRQEYLQAILEKYTKTEPMLTKKDICEVLVWELGDIEALCRAIKKEVKKEGLKQTYSQKVERELSIY